MTRIPHHIQVEIDRAKADARLLGQTLLAQSKVLSQTLVDFIAVHGDKVIEPDSILVVHWTVGTDGCAKPELTFTECEADLLARGVAFDASAVRLHLRNFPDFREPKVSGVIRVLLSDDWQLFTENPTFFHYASQLAVFVHEERKLKKGEAA